MTVYEIITLVVALIMDVVAVVVLCMDDDGVSYDFSTKTRIIISIIISLITLSIVMMLMKSSWVSIVEWLESTYPTQSKIGICKILLMIHSWCPTITVTTSSGFSLELLIGIGVSIIWFFVLALLNKDWGGIFDSGSSYSSKPEERTFEIETKEYQNFYWDGRSKEEIRVRETTSSGEGIFSGFTIVGVIVIPLIALFCPYILIIVTLIRQIIGLVRLK